jgi:hypothetical protein
MNQTRMTRNQRKYYRKKLFQQRLIALGILVCCCAVSIADQDATAIVLLAPLGIYALFTKKIIIY